MDTCSWVQVDFLWVLDGTIIAEPELTAQYDDMFSHIIANDSLSLTRSLLFWLNGRDKKGLC